MEQQDHRKHIREWIGNNLYEYDTHGPKTHYFQKCVDELDIEGITISNVRATFYKDRGPEKESKTKNKRPPTVNEVLREVKLKHQLKNLKSQYNELLNEHIDQGKRIEFLNDIREDSIPKFYPGAEGDRTQGCAFAILSDVHIEENVDPEVVNGINIFNPDVCKARIELFFQNVLKLVEKERQNIDINVLCLGLLGDNITGYIHEELQESNHMSPTEATRAIKALIMAGIKLLAENGDFDKIIIPCCKGNHGRTTTRKRFSTAYKNSYEWMMYHDMKETFEMIGGYDLLEWHIPKSEFTYVDIFDKRIRFGHGDHFNYRGGIGGLSIPLIKQLYRVDKQVRADFTFYGHWHQMLKPTGRCIINGSVIGFNAYALGIGAEPEEPAQQFQLLDSKRGFTVNQPILLS